MCIEMKRYKDAFDYLEKAFQIWKDWFHRDHDNLTKCYINVATCLTNTGMYAEAFTILEKLLDRKI